MKRAVVCLGVGKNWFPEGVARLGASVKEHSPDIDFCGITSWPLGCPTHNEVPWGFKPWAVQDAIEAGYESILWLDSSIWACRPLEPLFEYIEDTGSMFVRDAYTTGQWCTDAALPTLGTTREELLTVPHIWAASIGLCVHDERAVEFQREWLRLSRDGITFHGSGTNDKGQVSSDPRVKGHRHDQTAASFLAWKLGMEMIPWHHPENGFIVAESVDPGPPVCLLARGGIKGVHWD